MASKKKNIKKKSAAKQSLPSPVEPQPLRNVAAKKRRLAQIRRWNAGMLVFAAFLLGVGSGAAGWDSWHPSASPNMVMAAQPVGYGEGWDSLDIQAEAPISIVPTPTLASDSAQPLTSLMQTTQNLSTNVHVPILMYHYIRINPVATDKIGYGLSVTPADFEAQMNYLAMHGYHSISAGDVVDVLHGLKSLPAKPVVISFDDGYDDLYTVAYPILQKYRLQGEAYIITGKVGSPGYVTWDMLRQMLRDGGMTIGAHTIHHPDLRTLSKEQQFNEIEGSRVALQTQLGIPVDDFCYPAGAYTAQTVELVKQAGFKDAVTVEPKSTEYSGQEMTMPRVRVAGGETLDEFEKRLAE